MLKAELKSRKEHLRTPPFPFFDVSRDLHTYRLLIKGARSNRGLALFRIRRGFTVISPEIFRPLYLALVRPILEYGLQTSAPYLRQDSTIMGKLHRLVTRMVKVLRDLSYEDRLRRLNLFFIE